MHKLASRRKTRARAPSWAWRGRQYATLLLLTAVLFSITTATVNATSSVSPAANASPLAGATKHPIQYAIAGPPSMVDDGASLAYFKAHGFSIVELVVPDNRTYQAELTTITALGMHPVIDVEMVIWDGGKVTGPLSSFHAYFQSLENAGWEYVASEGLNSTDLAYMQPFFKGYVNYNCDECGLWQDVYINPFTVLNSWESYYPSEWPYIQNGSTQAAALGIQNGVMAGVWANVNGDNQIYNNSLNGSSPSYKSMLDWSYANGIGFSQFCVWCGLDSYAVSMYEELGFPQIVANLQTYYPAITTLNATISTATVYVNQNFTVNGTLSAAGGIGKATITLQRSTDNATWKNVTTNKTDTTGTYTFSRNESAAHVYYYRTRYAGNATYTNATSNVVKVTVTKIPTTLTASAPATASVGKNITVTGKLSTGSTAIKGQNVTLQRSRNSSTWVSVTGHTNTTNAIGGYTLTTKEPTAGTYYYRGYYAGTSSYAAAESKGVKVVVS